jgi:ABC-type polysaccharide/polyol phosphate transport system ATPase subunit
MSDIAIRLEGLGKQYKIGKREAYRSLRDTLVDALAEPFRRFGSGGPREDPAEKFWALRDVSFEVKQGEVVGIIGRNGAGKSTLLKVLSRITEPTEGYADIYGRIASLLEVGTGFHPELTGRENIYLNGAIMGMKKAEIRRQFDEIVAFAEVEKFLDTPVKHYSSGMHVRLGFSVAVHLEPEVLVVDEVLAVGDAEFQRKCLGKLKSVGRTSGRTILFVSHNMAAVRSICSRGLLLERGVAVLQGQIDKVVDSYLSCDPLSEAVSESVETPSFFLDSVRIRSLHGNVIKTFDTVQALVTFTPKEDITNFGMHLGILSADDQRITGLDLPDFVTLPPVPAGRQTSVGFEVASLPLLAGSYRVEIILKDLAHHKWEYVETVFPFEVAETPVYGGRKLDRWHGTIGLSAKPVVDESLFEEAMTDVPAGAAGAPPNVFQ